MIASTNQTEQNIMNNISMKNRKGRLYLGKQESAVTPINMAEVQDLIDQIQDEDAREVARKAVDMTWNYLAAMVKEHNEIDDNYGLTES